jgi:hypothetical protein
MSAKFFGGRDPEDHSFRLELTIQGGSEEARHPLFVGKGKQENHQTQSQEQETKNTLPFYQNPHGCSFSPLISKNLLGVKKGYGGDYLLSIQRIFINLIEIGEKEKSFEMSSEARPSLGPFPDFGSS